MDKEVRVIIAIGLVTALIVFGYTAGYQVGSSIGKDLTQTVETTEEIILDK